MLLRTILSRVAIVVIAVFAFSGGLMEVYAQTELVKRMPYADLKRYYLGFSIGGHTQDLQIDNAGFTRPNGKDLFAEVPEWRPGFSVGVIGGLVLYPNVELRLMPSLHFGDIPIAYGDGMRLEQLISMRSTSLKLPLQLKYASERLNNIRPYVAGGLYGSLNLGGKKGDLLRFKPMGWGMTLSVGCDLYMKFFKLSPELTFSYGFGDVIQHYRPEFVDDHRFYLTQAIARGRHRMISLNFNFQ